MPGARLSGGGGRRSEQQSFQHFVQVRTRRVENLETDYNGVYIEIKHAGSGKEGWKSQTVGCTGGKALLEAWARVPVAEAGYAIEIKARTLRVKYCRLCFHCE